MLAALTNSLDALRAWWSAATPATRAMATGLVLLLLVGLAVAASLAAAPDFQPIYHGVSGKDASAIEAVLREKSIPMHFDDKDGTVSVPSKDESNATMAVEAAGTLSKNTDIAGIETLDKIGMGTTSEVEKERINAANEGELARKLMKLDPIQSAAVSITPGDTSPYSDDKPSSASVILTLKSGESLSGLQVKGIVNLVAHAVSGLAAQNVTLTDQTGVPLWKDNGAGGTATDGAPGTENAKFSETKRQEVQTLLDGWIGPHKAIITVNAELDFDQTSRDAIQHTPAAGLKTGLPVSVRDKEENYSGTGQAPVGGIAGTGSNLNVPSYQTGGAAGGGGKYGNTNTETTYENDTTVTKTLVAQGGVKKMTVAALVDTSVPAENLPKIKDFVSAAIGATAGDASRSVSIQQIAFDNTAQKAQATQMAAVAAQALWGNVARALAVCAVAVVLLILLTRTGRRPMTAREPQLALAGGGANIGLLEPQTGQMPDLEMDAILNGTGSRRGMERMMEERPLTVEDVLAEMPEAEGRPRRRSRAPSIEENQDLKMEGIRSMITNHPESVSLLLKGWMADDAKVA